MKTPSLVLLATALAGCATTPPSINYATMDPAAVTAATTVNGSKFDKTLRVEAPAITTRTKLPSAPGQMVDYYENRAVFLRGVMAKSAPTMHSAYVEVVYEGKGWRFYQGANFVGGERATFLPIERKLIDCYPSLCKYSETFAVVLRESDVRGNGDIEFRLNSRTAGEDIITLPRNYINGYLAAVDR